jgi:hypothetical protein
VTTSTTVVDLYHYSAVVVEISDVVKLTDLADGQWGQVTIEQAEHVGVPVTTLADLEAARVVEPVIDGVVRFRAGGRHPVPRLYAQWLRLEPQTPAWQRSLPASGVVSHRSAVRLYRLGDLPGDHPQFTAETGTEASGGLVHRAELGPGAWRWLDGLPVTTPARTLMDLAQAEPLDITDLGLLARGFVQGGWATTEDLTAEFSHADRRWWVPLLDALQTDAAQA